MGCSCDFLGISPCRHVMRQPLIHAPIHNSNGNGKHALNKGPCSYRGKVVNGAILRQKGLDTRKEWVYCDHKHKPLGEVVCGCQGCGPNCYGYLSEEDAANAARIGSPRLELSRTRIDLKGHFNAGCIDYRGKLLLASRYNQAIYLSELNRETLQPIPQTMRRLSLNHESAKNGQEDPRLFTFRGRLRMTFSGISVSGTIKHDIVVNLLHAEFDDSLRVSKVWEPIYIKRRRWEKNWMPFETDAGRLFSVYDPGDRHVIIEHDTELGHSTFYCHHFWTPKFSGGVRRGGCPPILVRESNEYWHFFHGMRDHSNGNIYTCGLYTFDADSFEPKRIIPYPILSDESPSPRLRNENPAVYPCGAIRQGDEWWVSYGLYNTYTEIAKFRHADLERELRPV